MISAEQIGPKKLGERLRVARTNAGYRQEEAARELDMSRTTLVAIEQGERMVRPDELRRFALLYKITLSDLVREPAVHVDLTAQFRRIAVADGFDEDAADAARLLNRLATSSVEIEARLGKRRADVNLPPERKILSGPLEDQAEDLALEIRHRVGLGLGPVTDIVSLLEHEFGTRIFFRPLASRVSGLFAYHATVGPCMLVNALHPPERQIQTIAHELGHLMTRRSDASIVSVDRRSASREERFVTLFAMAFLLPGAAIRKKFRELIDSSGKIAPRHILLLAHFFGVSFEAMARRLEALTLLPSGTADMLKQRGFEVQKARKALGLAETRALVATPPRLMLLAVEAYRRELLSEGQLSQMLALERVELREQLSALGGDSENDEITVPT